MPKPSKTIGSLARSAGAKARGVDGPLVGNGQDLDEIILPIRATGASDGEVLALAAQAVGADRIMPALAKALDHHQGQGHGGARWLLGDVAKAAPDLARKAFLEWGKERTFAGTLDLEGADWLECLPEGMKIPDGNLILRHCRNLVALPERLEVRWALDLSGCSALERIPVGVRVRGSMEAGGCVSLRSLPEGFRVGGYLNLHGCVGLTELPRKFVVADGDLTLIDCANIRSLPFDLKVPRGRLNLHGCPMDELSDDELKALAPGVRSGRYR